MARSPFTPAPLTAEQTALVDSLELFVEGMLGSAMDADPGYVVVPLPVKPDVAVATELRRRYLAAGWQRVIVSERPGCGDSFIQLEALVDVWLSGRPA